MAFKVTTTRFSVDNYEDMYLDDGTSYHHYSGVSENFSADQYGTDDEILNVTMTYDITKSNEERGLVSGWANVAVNKDGSIPLDWDDDVVTADVLEKAAIDFMVNSRDSGVDHKGSTTGTVVESIVFTKEKCEALGIPENTVNEGWFITVKLHDKEVFKKVKDGELKMFSIHGKAKAVKL